MTTREALRAAHQREYPAFLRDVACLRTRNAASQQIRKDRILSLADELTPLPKAPYVHLAGHSNGGMMANRMWCEAPRAFDAYGAISGPASTALTAESCTPSDARPFLAVVGDEDTIIQTKNAWDDATWSINSCLQSGSGDAFVDPTLQNDVSFFEAVRIPAACDVAAAAPVTSGDGSRTSWSACDGKLRLERVQGADHCVVAGRPCRNNLPLGGGSCSNSLESVSGLRMRALFTSFFAANE